MYAIKHENGTFFQRWTAIGPMFGGEQSEAQTFGSMTEAELAILASWKFYGCAVVKVS